MTLGQWITIYMYRALTDQALRELLVILSEEGKDGKGDSVGIPDQGRPGGCD